MLQCTWTGIGQDSAEANSMHVESQPDAAQQSTDILAGSMDMVPATPSPQACMTVDEEMREHIQVSLAVLYRVALLYCIDIV